MTAKRNCWSCAKRVRAEAADGPLDVCGWEVDTYRVQRLLARRWLGTFALVDGMPPKPADYCPSYQPDPTAAMPARTTVRVPCAYPPPPPLTQHDEALRYLRATVDALVDENADLTRRITDLEARLG